VYEPFLLRLGFLDRTPSGRVATEAARQHLARLGYEIPPARRPEPEMAALWELGEPEGLNDESEGLNDESEGLNGESEGLDDEPEALDDEPEPPFEPGSDPEESSPA
jgi:RuvB C-terminal winged helix domain